MDCKHIVKVSGHWEKNPYFDQSEDDCDGYSGDSHEWIPEYECNTVIDINLHQYKCTQCGKIFNY